MGLNPFLGLAPIHVSEHHPRRHMIWPKKRSSPGATTGLETVPVPAAPIRVKLKTCVPVEKRWELLGAILCSWLNPGIQREFLEGEAVAKAPQ